MDNQTTLLIVITLTAICNIVVAVILTKTILSVLENIENGLHNKLQLIDYKIKEVNNQTQVNEGHLKDVKKTISNYE